MRRLIRAVVGSGRRALRLVRPAVGSARRSVPRARRGRCLASWLASALIAMLAFASSRAGVSACSRLRRSWCGVGESCLPAWSGLANGRCDSSSRRPFPAAGCAPDRPGRTLRCATYLRQRADSPAPRQRDRWLLSSACLTPLSVGSDAPPTGLSAPAPASSRRQQGPSSAADARSRCVTLLAWTDTGLSEEALPYEAADRRRSRRR